ncbi:aminopeptidase P family protein [Halobacteriales archaeon QS_8_69_26]|nr:MAG: aminopeptidase P family protein [Halobacteriales archaeon QS_8_69_26]
MPADGPFERRIRECQSALEGDADAAVLFPGPNLTYLTGFDEDPSERHFLLFVTPGDVAFVVPELSAAQVRDATHVEDLRVWADGDDPAAVVADAVGDLGLRDDDGSADGRRILLDDRLWSLFARDVRAALPGAEFGLASETLDDLRITKDDAELAAMREAGRIADEVSKEVRRMGSDAVGLTERDLAEAIRERLEARGGDGVSFETIVAAGPNGARPHHHHGDRQIREGDPVVLDFGTRVDGYPSDQTRTVVFAGDPPDGFTEAFEAVRDAQAAAVDAVEPGVEAREIDRAAREVIEGRGYGDAFVHRTGHGVGLEVHEAPYIVEGNDTELAEGMVFSVEPGVYVEGEFGIRIEDLVAVTAEGAERLNDSPRGWEPLG